MVYFKVGRLVNLKLEILVYWLVPAKILSINKVR